MPNLETNQTLADVLGEATHPSALLDKIRGMVGNQDPGRCLQQLGVNRGCRHYDGAFQPPTTFPEEINALSNEEAGIALCIGSLPYDHTGIRLASAFLSGTTCQPDRIVALALSEHCQTVVGYIARCAKLFEASNPVWDRILAGVAPINTPPSGSLPHWSRFISGACIRPGDDPNTIWLRVNPHPERTWIPRKWHSPTATA